MDTAIKAKVITLRPQHMCCMRFMRVGFEELGQEYVQVRDSVKTLLRLPESPIMAAEGPDMLCQKCSNFRNDRCASPLGGEDEVRKWDAILLREIGVPFGSCMTSGEWHNLLRKKIPFKLCSRCQWNEKCSMGADLA